MGILDDLRDEASQQQSDQQQDNSLQEQLEHNYQVLILPKMQQIFAYFKELVDYLNVIKTPVAIAHYCNRYPDFGQLQQLNYRLSTDKHGGMSHFDKMMDVYLRFNCLSEENEDYIHLANHKIEADQEKEFLMTHKIPFKIEQHLGDTKNGALSFRITRKIPVLFNFSVDYDNSRILLNIQNHEDFELRSQIVEPADINEAYLDKLARYILRKDQDFLRMEIDDVAKQKIREHINVQKQIHANELEMATIRDAQELEEQEKNKLKNKVKSFIKKIVAR